MIPAVLALALLFHPDLPTIIVTRDDTPIDRSCRVVIPAGTVIDDANNDGVLHVAADGITVEFAPGSVLWGCPPGTPPDLMKGVGIAIDGHGGVAVRGAAVHGFRVGIRARNANGLTIDSCDVSGGYAMHLKSTPQAEDESDWLWPHENDQGQWGTNYGAGIQVERSGGVTIRNCTARRRQNGIILDRVRESRVYDNDCSFLSGWGLAMWRCEGNTITRNAFDFCVRGYSHGVYNRGQDSAGILFFEQNRNNIIAENSATHGGDGFFGFGGKEAIAQNPPPPGVTLDYKGLGNSGNVIVNNDFSYAPAHGIELTFSFDNRIIGNTVVGNAICGVWGGYSQDTLIAKNLFADNGDRGYGLERGGVNIEHGAGNQIVGNTFRNNSFGVHLWWDEDKWLDDNMPWVSANDRGSGTRRLPSTDNFIAENTFEGGETALVLHDCDATTTARNTFTNVGKVIDASQGSAPVESPIAVSYAAPTYEALGDTRPVGARKDLAGRENIVMTDWFPWDHRSPLARVIHHDSDTCTLEFTGIDSRSVRTVVNGHEDTPTPHAADTPWQLTFAAPHGVTEYSVKVAQGDYNAAFSGTLIKADWDTAVFAWPAPEPRETPEGPRIPPDLAAWRALATGPGAVHTRLPGLNFSFGGRGPSGVIDDPAVKAARFGGDYFGVIATASVSLPPGRWRVITRSDDGIRIFVNGTPVIDNWTWHGPAENRAEFDATPGNKPTVLRVEYFEIMGGATLDVRLEPVP
ncbi:MAG: right-handed parallel beta-helix repeat-containing protein [Phycisphaerales bacterium]|nr:right-handed parallel beta-helix repeat-containing protein [Phycisphaerales bacterium]